MKLQLANSTYEVSEIKVTRISECLSNGSIYTVREINIDAKIKVPRQPKSNLHAEVHLNGVEGKNSLRLTPTQINLIRSTRMQDFIDSLEVSLPRHKTNVRNEGEQQTCELLFCNKFLLEFLIASVEFKTPTLY